MEKARNTDEINNGAIDTQANSVQGINRNGGVVEQAGATYMECRRNHAAFIGGHILDGCGKFVKGSAGMFQDQNKEALLCARCGCHRNFHRKVLPRQSPHLRDTTRYHHILNYLCNSLPLKVLQPRPPTPWLLRSKPLTSYELIEGQGSSLSPEEAEEEKSESDPGDEVDQPSKINKAG